MANPKGNNVLIARATSGSVLGALLAAGCAVVLAACGSTRSTGYHNSRYPYGAPNVPISMSKCMRANGVPNFPDPREGPNGGGVGWPGGGPVMISSDVLLIMGQQLAGPVVASAAKTCQEYMAPSGPPPVVSESERVAAIANAECMRKHGVPNFPDPTFSGGRFNAGLAGVDPQSPAFKQAAAACGDVGGSGQRIFGP
ncbi:MAG: hypothetical protein ACLP0J_14075 [Solirubrobacteraceae bacterium]